MGQVDPPNSPLFISVSLYQQLTSFSVLYTYQVAGTGRPVLEAYIGVIFLGINFGLELLLVRPPRTEGAANTPPGWRAA